MSQIQTSTKKRFFKKSKKKPEKGSTRVQLPKAQPQKALHSVINREIFGKSKAFVGRMNFHWGIVGVLTAIALVMSFLAGMQLYTTFLSWSQLMSKRGKLVSEMALWQNIATEYPNYRDAYVEGALYAYRLGDRQKETYFISQLQLLDPNFPLTKTLETLTNLQDILK